MGVPFLAAYLRANYPHLFRKLRRGQKLRDVDIFCVDANGLIHPLTQEAFRYGAHKPLPSLLHKEKIVLPPWEVCFKKIGERLRELVAFVRPRKKLVICIDGVAGAAKQAQQRQRRFRSAQERAEGEFDSNAITPGTEFMDQLTTYLDEFFRQQVMDEWKHLEIIFSGDRVPGEGEHKIINYLRYHGDPSESYCLHGLDADLIFLALGTQFPHFQIVRDEQRDPTKDFEVIDIGALSREIVSLLFWEVTSEEDEKERFVCWEERIIDDFVALCFLLGNDFLPHSPSLVIFDGGVETLLDSYQMVGEEYGHLTERRDYTIRFRLEALAELLQEIARHEQRLLEERYLLPSKRYADPMLERHLHEGKLDFEVYRKEYYQTHFPGKTVTEVCHAFLEGMSWVLTYYIYGIPHWNWYYPFHYAPFATDLAEAIATFHPPVYGVSRPAEPFQQLLSVLPPKSAELLPPSLRGAFSHPELIEFYPTRFEIDLSGKKQDWQAIILLPFLPPSLLEKIYQKLKNTLTPEEKRRNRRELAKSYKRVRRECSVWEIYLY